MWWQAEKETKWSKTKKGGWRSSEERGVKEAEIFEKERNNGEDRKVEASYRQWWSWFQGRFFNKANVLHSGQV